jgi:hypothetical protein
MRELDDLDSHVIQKHIHLSHCKYNRQHFAHKEKLFLLLKNAVFWDVAPCRSCVNRRSETSVHKIFTWRHIPQYDILHSHRCENLKPFFITYYS